MKWVSNGFRFFFVLLSNTILFLWESKNKTLLVRSYLFKTELSDATVEQMSDSIYANSSSLAQTKLHWHNAYVFLHFFYLFIFCLFSICFQINVYSIYFCFTVRNIFIIYLKAVFFIHTNEYTHSHFFCEN